MVFTATNTFTKETKPATDAKSAAPQTALRIAGWKQQGYDDYEDCFKLNKGTMYAAWCR